MYYGGELTSILYPEIKTSSMIAKKLLGVFALPYIKLFNLNMGVSLVGISLAKNHALAWTHMGILYAWGLNAFGVIGLTNNEHRLNEVVNKPTKVDMGLGENPGICYALATDNASLLLNFRGRVYHWGK